MKCNNKPKTELYLKNYRKKKNTIPDLLTTIIVRYIKSYLKITKYKVWVILSCYLGQLVLKVISKIEFDKKSKKLRYLFVIVFKDDCYTIKNLINDE